MPPATLPKLPTLVLPKIKLLQEKLACNVIQPYEGERPVGDEFTKFVHNLHDEIPRVPFSTLHASVQHLAGQLITPDVNKELSWRLAGNQHYLRKGITIPPYSRQLFPEWVPVQVWDLERKLGVRWIGDKKDNNKVIKSDIDLELFVLAGTPAGRMFSRSWPVNMFKRREAKTMLGFSHFDRMLWDRYFTEGNNYPMHDIRELVRLRFFLYLDTKLLKPDEYEREQLNCSGAMKKWNREIMKKRERKVFQCPKNYELSQVPCFKCEIGYLACPAACHSATYLKKFCSRCKTVANFANTQADWCVDCLAKKT